MLAKIIDKELKKVNVFSGTDTNWAISQGYSEMEVEQAYNGNWYVQGYAPQEPAPTEEEQRQKRAEAYKQEVDPITAHIQRLRDEEQTEEVIAEIQALIVERDEKVADIKSRYPYPVGENDPEYDTQL